MRNRWEVKPSLLWTTRHPQRKKVSKKKHEVTDTPMSLPSKIASFTSGTSCCIAPLHTMASLMVCEYDGLGLSTTDRLRPGLHDEQLPAARLKLVTPWKS